MTIIEVSSGIKDLLTAAAIIIGGLWAIYRWGYSEWLRRRKEEPALDGSLDIQIVQNLQMTAYVTLVATWNNKSPLPFKVNTKESGVDIYKFPSTVKIGAITTQETLGDPIISYKPYKDIGSMTLHPSTASCLQSHYHLEKNNTYFFQWQLIGAEAYFYRRTLILHIPE